MNCLVNIEPIFELDFELSLPISKEQRLELTQHVFKYVRNLYENSISDCSDAYLADPISFDNVSCVFGFESPIAIVELAKKWNAQIVENFEVAVKKLEEIKKSTGSYPIDSPETYEMKKAAMALDNSFYDFADTASGVNRWRSSFSALLSDEDMRAIEQNPSIFALIEVYPK